VSRSSLAPLGRSFARGVDVALDRAVAPGYTRIGYAVRRALPGWPADPAPGALAGRHVLVTGASSGLGIATAAGAARLGATVHLVVRDLEKGGRVQRELEAEHPEATFRLWRCDVGDLDDVRRAAAEIGAGVPRIDAIVHNAGVMPPERTDSAQGHELSLAVHVLGPILLTELLLPSLEAARDEVGYARVVMVTSGGMYTQKLRDDDLEYREGEYKPATAYARSKRVQVELLDALGRRWSDSGVEVHATHPGWADTPGVTDSLPGFAKVTGPVLRSAEEGADTVVWLLAHAAAVPTGGFWHDRRPRTRHYLSSTRPSADAVARTWAWVRDAAGLDGAADPS